MWAAERADGLFRGLILPSRSHSVPLTKESVESFALAVEPDFHGPVLPVLRPRLPSAPQIAPYLHLIDERRCYSNLGPLCLELQAQLARHLGCDSETLLMASSGTSAITAALLALDLPENSNCVMPSWTFAATPHAALAAGLKPWFVDIDRRTWSLDPKAVLRTLVFAPKQAHAVIVVSPFGAPLDIRAWESFQSESGTPVIIDAAAGFDTVRSSALISVVSLHATKVFGAGEGGFIVSPTSAQRDRIRACSNFGFDGSRIATRRAINSKMSEYHAAVALASFENWPAMRLRHLQIADWYKRALNSLPGVTLQPGYGDGWACGTTNVLLESDSAESIARYLLREGIETRMWWGEGCHVQPAFSEFNREDLAGTEFLGKRVLGLPHFVDMERADVFRVADVLAGALKSRSSGRRRAI